MHAILESPLQFWLHLTLKSSARAAVGYYIHEHIIISPAILKGMRSILATKSNETVMIRLSVARNDL